MARSVAISAVIASVLIGCVSLGPGQTTQPTLAPSFAITTPAPSASATLAPTASPASTATPTEEATPSTTAVPTVGPSVTPAPPLTPAPSLAVIEDFGADELLFTDDFSDPTSGFGIGANSGGTVGYVDEELQFDLATDDSWMWSRRAHALRWNVIHVEADVTPSANGYGGLLCADDEEELYGAVANTSGMWAFVSLDDDGVNILASNLEAGWPMAPGTTTRMALDCSGTQIGSFRMQLSLPDVGMAAIYEGAAGEGDDGFDRVGVYAEASVHPFQLRVDNLAAYGGEGDTSTSPEARALLLHVPADWRPDCFETPPPAFDSGALTSLSCPLADGRSNVVDFVQFDTQENMDAAYQARVDTWAVDSTASCQSGPNEGNYTIGGLTAGRILCAPQTSGIRFDWTHDELLILSTLTDFDGSYPSVYQDWLVAGPE